MSKYPALEYQDYLQLDRLLSSQTLKSAEYKAPAHDEMLFIIVHQTYELWFKQILTEIDSILPIFAKDLVDERDMGTILSRLKRIAEIQSVLIHQIRVMETMTPLDFLEFREFLYPASGFQSVQNRLIENKMGLKRQQRLKFNQSSYEQAVAEKYRSELLQSEEQPSLFELVEKWLERTPFLNIKGFDFWQEYRQSVQQMFQQDIETVNDNPALGREDRQRNLMELQKTQQTFDSLFDLDRYEELRREGHWRFSFKALHAALFIHIYRDQPVLQQPFNVLQNLLDIDEQFTTWRYRHALMAHRMLGRKIGTGGSSGHDYLRTATEKHKLFTDLFNLTTFFIPRSRRPQLPPELEKRLGFHYTQVDH